MPAKSAFAGIISVSSLKKLAGERYFERGSDYFDGGAVVRLRSGTDWISGRVQGTEVCPYAVRFWLEKQELQWGCTCPLGLEGEFCKHVVATGLAWLSGGVIEHEPEIPEVLEAVRIFLASADRRTLAELLGDRVAWDDSLLAELLLTARSTPFDEVEDPLRSQSPHAQDKPTGKSRKGKK